jgi:hypothetical protein
MRVRELERWRSGARIRSGRGSSTSAWLARRGALRQTAGLARI